MANLKSQIESLLFVSPKPLTIRQLAKILQQKRAIIEKEINELQKEYVSQKRGWQIIRSAGKLQLVSAPENAEIVQKLIKDEVSGELTRPALETLTIIVYRGPIAKADLDRIRGVNCALILRNLLLRGLIEAKEDKQKGQTYYTASLDFIRYLGVGSAAELPGYERLHADDTLARMLADNN